MNDNADNIISNQSTSESLHEVQERRISRRGFVKTSLALGIGGAALQLSDCGEHNPESTVEQHNQWRESNSYKSRYDFKEVFHGADETHHVAPDHKTNILIRWGDPLFSDAPKFDPLNQTSAAQLKQFGYNNDYIGYLPLKPKHGQSVRALLCVNHEYPIPGLMFPNFPSDGYENITEEQVKVSQAAVGNSIIEVIKVDNEWLVNTDSKYNRRITALDTEIKLAR
jgi:secreted PhoX family phosphatase